MYNHILHVSSQYHNAQIRYYNNKNNKNNTKKEEKKRVKI